MFNSPFSDLSSAKPAAPYARLPGFRLRYLFQMCPYQPSSGVYLAAASGSSTKISPASTVDCVLANLDAPLLNA